MTSWGSECNNAQRAEHTQELDKIKAFTDKIVAEYSYNDTDVKKCKVGKDSKDYKNIMRNIQERQSFWKGVSEHGSKKRLIETNPNRSFRSYMYINHIFEGEKRGTIVQKYGSDYRQNSGNSKLHVFDNVFDIMADASTEIAEYVTSTPTNCLVIGVGQTGSKKSEILQIVISNIYNMYKPTAQKVSLASYEYTGSDVVSNLLDEKVISNQKKLHVHLKSINDDRKSRDSIWDHFAWRSVVFFVLRIILKTGEEISIRFIDMPENNVSDLIDDVRDIIMNTVSKNNNNNNTNNVDDDNEDGIDSVMKKIMSENPRRVVLASFNGDMLTDPNLNLDLLHAFNFTMGDVQTITSDLVDLPR